MNSSETVNITLNGQKIDVPKKLSIYQAAEREGIHIPTLCYEEGLSIPGCCRMCVVEVKGARNLIASCATKVQPGMEIETESPDVVEARRELLKLYLANHDLRCLTCPRNGDCRLQDYCYRYQVEDNPYAWSRKDFGMEDANPFILRDYNKCIKCGKCARICAEVNGARVYDFISRGFESVVTSAFNQPLEDSTCTFCGMCVQVCPVAALVEKSTLWEARPWEQDKVKTTCPYCGVGCQLKLKVADGRIVGVAKDTSGSNKGHLCVKGQFGWEFVHSSDRLTKPLVRKDGQLVETSWHEALATVASKLREIKEKYNGTAIAGLASAKCTNEENYLFQKLLRVVFGTNHIDHCARL